MDAHITLPKMLRRERCVRARYCLIFHYSDLEKQEELGCGFDFFLPPEMCLNGCAGDGCLRNQQKLSCLAGAESFVLPRAGRQQGRYKCSRWKSKRFFCSARSGNTMKRQHQQLPASTSPSPGPGHSAPNRCQPGSDHPRRNFVPLQAEGRWVFAK